MATELKVLIDLNVLLDVLQRREPHYEASAQFLRLVERGKIQGWVAAHSLTTLHYLLAKYESPERAHTALTELLALLSVAAVDQVVLEQALNLPYQDFEDAVQMMAGVRAGAEYIVTRNTRDYRQGPLPAVQPAELLHAVQ